MIFDGPEEAPVTLLLAHGAGAPMDSASMTAAAQALAFAGLRVARFEFGYMAVRRSGQRKPPPRAETLQPELIVIASHGRSGVMHLLLGSTAEKVVRHATCEVLVVRTK